MLTQTEQKPPDGQTERPRARRFPLLPKAAPLRRQEYATSLGDRRASLPSFRAVVSVPIQHQFLWVKIAYNPHNHRKNIKNT